MIYTTNAIESVNSQLRKIIRNKKVFPNDMAVFKIFYLAIENITKNEHCLFKIEIQQLLILW
ncbi:hypothetical protein SHM_19850 [Spiroplasma ixodetis]|uniref:Mutator family transposase n=1 Tax=Spiroplasma ixodetis TaxID=2141 RepID=A0ABN6SYW5_9MOLU|nr:hypothetical protein SHM_19850 [Spiroplasma ixodetis]